MNEIKMLNLKGQYEKIKEEVDVAVKKVMDSSAFINGPQVADFGKHLAEFTGAGYVITCGNGTDALQIALMALGLEKGDEVIVPAFTYVSSAEVIALLGYTPVMVDVDPATFEVSLEHIMAAYTKRTKAIIPVHLFGQNCDMEPIMQFARSHGLYVIEDAAQSIGSEYIFSDGKRRQSGTMGDVGCTSFFPTKNLGCYGDGGAMFTNDPDLAARLKMIANHGQKQKYHHSVIGCNSRLDTIQAAVLDVKLRHLGEYCMERRAAADYYTACIKEWDPDCRFAETPVVKGNTTHVFHQYTLKIKNGQRDGLKKYLNDNGIAAMIYYPLPLNRQKAFEGIAVEGEQLYNAAALAKSVLSLPVDTEITRDMQDVVLKGIFDYFETGK